MFCRSREPDRRHNTCPQTLPRCIPAGDGWVGQAGIRTIINFPLSKANKYINKNIYRYWKYILQFIIYDTATVQILFFCYVP